MPGKCCKHFWPPREAPRSTRALLVVLVTCTLCLPARWLSWRRSCSPDLARSTRAFFCRDGAPTQRDCESASDSALQGRTCLHDEVLGGSIRSLIRQFCLEIVSRQIFLYVVPIGCYLVQRGLRVCAHNFLNTRAPVQQFFSIDSHLTSVFGTSRSYSFSAAANTSACGITSSTLLPLSWHDGGKAIFDTLRSRYFSCVITNSNGKKRPSTKICRRLSG